MTPPTRSSQVKDWCLIIMFLAAVFAAISMATERSERTRQETLALCLGVFGLAFLVASVKYWWPNSRRFRSVSTVTAAWGALVCLYYSFFAAAGWYGAEIKAILITLAAPAAMLAPMGYRLLVDSQGLAPRGQPPPSPGMEQLFDNMTGLGAAKKYPSMEIPKLPEQLRERVVALLVVICDRAKVWDPAKWTCDEAQALSEIAMTGRVQRLHLVCLRSHARSAWLIGREMRGANQPRIDNLLAQLELVVKEALQDLEVVLSKRPAR